MADTVRLTTVVGVFGVAFSFSLIILMKGLSPSAASDPEEEAAYLPDLVAGTLSAASGMTYLYCMGRTVVVEPFWRRYRGLIALAAMVVVGAAIAYMVVS
jgi:hypothetical protein